MPARRPALLGGVAGPAAFVAAWAIGGAVATGYSPVDDPISRLAAVGASTRPLMTAGFLGFGAGVAAFAAGGLRPSLDGPAWLAALAAGACTVGVGAVPLDGGRDGLHGVLAGLGYAALVAVPALAARPLARDGRRDGAAAVVVAAVAAACLVASATASSGDGLLQRLGLTTVDAWLALTAVRLWRRS
jgi:hypothetical protein